MVLSMPSAVALAQEGTEALKRAYILNGNSMVGNYRMIDLTDPAVLKADKVVTTTVIRPDAPPPPVEKKAAAPKAAADVCTRHGKRKVVRGRSWRCR